MPHDGGESSKAFYRLFNYIDGSNDADSKIPMTAPVSMRIVPGEGPNCEMKVVARRFGGFPTDITYSSEAANLYGLAMEQGMMVKDIPLWTAVYDGPSVIIHRRNEVWLEI